MTKRQKRMIFLSTERIELPFDVCETPAFTIRPSGLDEINYIVVYKNIQNNTLYIRLVNRKD